MKTEEPQNVNIKAMQHLGGETNHREGTAPDREEHPP